MVLDSTCSPCVSHFTLFILGLIFAFSSTHGQATRVDCTSDHFLPKYQHCGQQPDGVNGLECSGKYNNVSHQRCAWKPGKHTSKKTYTLLIKQDKYCKIHRNITGFSTSITVFQKRNMTLEVVENGEWGNCTKAVFSASPKSLLRCDPPNKVSFRRHSGELSVSVSWQSEDRKAVQYFSVRYKAVGSLKWIEPSVQSQDRHRHSVARLNSSLSYVVQIQCVTNDKCLQCPQSESYTVPQELTSPPVIVKHEDTDVVGKTGSRQLSLTWTFPATEPNDGYYVTIVKASGEDPRERISVTEPEITLILSYSAYHLNISAVNNASTSPAVSLTIPERDGPPSAEEKLSVKVHSNSSFTVYWKDDLIKTYVCFSAEWRKKGQKAVTSMSFHQNEDNFNTLTDFTEPLEPYKRYSIALHTRPEKRTCNIKYINNSESTYASSHFYFMEGSPVSGPNISSYNVTLNSVVLQWLSIPEEDIRGFLLGYLIFYTENLHRGTSLERNVTVDPQSDTYELGDLKAGTTYQVQVSGFTQAGVGVRSTACVFKTNHQGYFHPNLSALIIIFAVVATVLIFSSPLIKRAKVVLWPSIPNPGNSYTIQKMERPGEMELFTSIFSTLKIEEWDTSSLQIVEREDEVPPIIVPLVLSFHHDSEDEDSAERTCNWIQSASGGDDAPNIISNLPTSTFAFSSEYTTMEMFQQAMPQVAPAVDTAISQTGDSSDAQDTTVVKTSLDHVGQLTSNSN
ncbi:interleukin-31 receptor subunit alpha-like [Solea senegalensis]|nr:interleukin-31 receptor subunit alpha [Solea senegalensis]KAG7499681.1 interleukin-31 receptor subunit alpha-like [Solea senegalensis]